MERGVRASISCRWLCKFLFLFWFFLSHSLLIANKITNYDQVNGVQLAIPGQFVAPFEYLNEVPLNGLDINGDNQTDIIPPCSCRTQPAIANGTNPNSGYFDDQIVIATGISGQQWQIATIINVYHPGNLTPITNGTLIPEVGNTGVYVLPMAHQDAVGYILGVENTIDHPGMLFGPLVNTCYYPDPFIENLADTYCDTEPNIIMSGNVTSDFDDNFIPFQPETEFWSITRLEDNANFITQTFSPATLGGGHYLVRYTVNAGSMPFLADNNTGCSITVEKEVEVRNSHVMACNSGLNITLNPNTCQVIITPSMILANDPEDESLFTIDVLAPGGGSLGNIIPAEFAGLDLLVRIEDFCSGDFCFSTVRVRDFTAPVLTIPDDITIACFEIPDTSLTGVATATDCSPFTISFEDSVVDSECGNPISTVFRNWSAVDVFGNPQSQVQVISIARGGQAELYFPSDVEYSCGDYLANPQIIDATEAGAGIPTLVEEEMCGLIYTKTDETISLCGDPTRSFVIIRTWVVLDLCGNTLFNTDANGNDNIQFIRVEDDTPPQVMADPVTASAVLAPQSTGLENCSSTGFIPAPVVMDECNDYDIEILTPIGEAVYANGENGASGGFIPFPGLELGTHDISYVVTDACGNETVLVIPVEVIDDLPPIMICNNFISLVLSSDGMGRIMPSAIDEGSRDDCCTDILKVKLQEEPDSLFRDFIDLNCETDTLVVVLGVWDCAGNFNECIAEVSVEDRIPPFVQQGVEDTTLSCLEDYQSYLNADFFAPIFADNCGVNIEFEANETVDDCGAGIIIRTWTATDNPLNVPATFTQTVTLSMDIDYQIPLPGDATFNCNDLNFTDMPPTSSGCEMLATTVLLDTLFPPIDSICYQLLRTHQIINWCEYDGVSDPLILPRGVILNGSPQIGVGYELRSDGNQIFQETSEGEEEIGEATGFYHYQQLINVIDTIAPQLSFDDPPAFCTSDTTNSCIGLVNFSFAINDNCPGGWSVTYFLDDFSEPAGPDPFGQLTYIGEGTYSISGAYPVGTFAFELMVTDMCGRISQETVAFLVEDCNVPSLTCTGDSSFSLAIDGTVSLTPEDLVMSFEDNCGIAELSFSMMDPLDDQRVFDCDSLGQKNIAVWGRDNNGNQSVCEATIFIIDDIDACLQHWKIDGLVFTEEDELVAQTIVRLTGLTTEEDTTGLDGKYDFQNVPEGIGYKITPGKNVEFDNGLSTLDLLLITKHILGVSPFDSPYKIIAADANRSGTVSTFDIILFRKLILNIDQELSDNTSWRFVPEDYVFPNPENPFLDNFPEDILLQSLDRDTSFNFIGIKIGDVNGSVNSANILEVEERNMLEPLTFWAEDQILQESELFELYVEGKYEAVLGGQFALGWDLASMELIEVIPGETVEQDHFGFYDNQNGALSISWFQLEAADNPGFNLKFRAKKTAPLRELIWLAQELVKSEIYLQDRNGQVDIKSLELDFRPSPEEMQTYHLWQNVPNPFKSKTKIQFSLPQKEFVQFVLFDGNGTILTRLEGNYEQGIHEIELGRNNFKGAGLLYYQLRAGEYEEIRKMLLID